MFSFILALLLALLCPKPTNTSNCDNKNPQVTTMDDTGGETGNPPPKPPTPPGGGQP